MAFKEVTGPVVFVKVPPIRGTHEGREYSLENIDLTSFVLEADKMEVLNSELPSARTLS